MVLTQYCRRVLASVVAESTLGIDFRSLFSIVLLAAGIPLLVGLLNLRVAEVVFLIAGGIVIGPEVLNLVTVTDSIDLLAELGLGFLFFFAGYELDGAVLRGASGRQALIGWVASIALATVAVLALYSGGVINDTLGVAIALTSTALGTLLPMIRDSGRLETQFGRSFMAAGAVGEFGPILAIAILLGGRSSWLSLIVVIAFCVLAILIALVPRRFMSNRVLQIIERGHTTSQQTAVRIVVLLLVGLLALANSFSLDVVLGAFAAGIIVRFYTPSDHESLIKPKVEALAFGFFIPLFFVVTGVKLDIQSIIENPGRLLIFFMLLLVVRGLPQLLVYRRSVPNIADRAELSLFIATALPIIVAVTTVQVNAGIMRPANAAALVGAGALSVLVFPLLGQTIGRRGGSGAGAHATEGVERDSTGNAGVE